MTPRIRAAVAFGLCLAAGTAVEQANLVPVFSIWDVALGQPVATIDPQSVALIACGTNGWPPAQPLTRFDDLSNGTPEASGLTEVQFSYDDEQDFLARALELEYRVLHGGTSVFAHPVIVSVLVDAQGLAQGIRIVTDDRISGLEHRPALTLAKNFKARFSAWNLACTDLPRRPGSQTWLNDVARMMNGRPRKTLGWKTPAEAMAEEIKAFSSTVALEA